MEQEKTSSLERWVCVNCRYRTVDPQGENLFLYQETMPNGQIKKRYRCPKCGFQMRPNSFPDMVSTIDQKKMRDYNINPPQAAKKQ